MPVVTSVESATVGSMAEMPELTASIPGASCIRLLASYAHSPLGDLLAVGYFPEMAFIVFGEIVLH